MSIVIEEFELSSKQPVHEIRVGTVCAAIWQNSGGKSSSWYSVSVTRIFQQGAEWKRTQSFNRDDLPVVSKVSEMAYAWIWTQNELKGDGSE